MVLNPRRPAAYLGLAALLALPGPAAGREPLSVAVAASALPALEALQESFRARTGLELRLVSGSSGRFSAQIRAGAPFDLFLSADVDAPARLHADGYAEAPRVYARGRLVLWTARADFPLERGLAGLADPAVKKIAVPDPAAAPYGRAALEALEKAGLRPAVMGRLVYGESVGQTNQFIASGAADAGMTAKSAVFAPRAVGLGRWSEVPADLHAPLDQAFVVLRRRRGGDPEAAARLAEFLLSAEARRVWARFGFEAPPAGGER